MKKLERNWKKSRENNENGKEKYIHEKELKKKTKRNTAI